MNMRLSWLVTLCACTVLSLLHAAGAHEEAARLRDPMLYPSQLSAPTGYDPLKDFGTKRGKVPRRYIVRMRREISDLKSAIAGVLVSTSVSTSSVDVSSVSSPDSTFAVKPASLAAVGATPQTNFSGGGLQGFVLEIPDGVNEADAVSQLAANPDVMHVVPDTWVGIAAATVRLASAAEATTSLLRIGAIVPSKRPTSSARPMVQASANGSVTVALIDTGCDVTNPDLNVIGGVDFTSDNSYGLDGNGHGTHVAGILGAKGDGSGIVGMFPSVPLFCLKVLGATGQGTMGTVVTALTWVAQNGRRKGIRVVNLSLSGETNNEVCEAITAVTKQGITVVVAAGNNGQDMARFSPANCPAALVVTAMSDFDGQPGGLKGPDPTTGEMDDQPARYSNYAAKGKPGNIIAAPGTRILSYMPAYKCKDGSASCIPGTPNLAYLSGTSMAAPIVTGQLAMCYEKGVCRSNAASEFSKVVRPSGSHSRSNKQFGFKGDPYNGPISGRHYGSLIYGNSY